MIAIIKKLTITFFVAFFFCSCCMTYRVYLSNNSSTPRNIKVDPKDLRDTSFSFVLDTGRIALIQSAAGVLNLAENIIIDNTDTFYLKDINKLLKEKRATGHKRWWGRDFIINMEK